MTKTMPEWLHERNEDPCGTSNRHPFWDTVDADDVAGSYRVFKRDGKWYAYDRRWNAWYGFGTLEELIAHVARPGAGWDPWA